MLRFWRCSLAGSWEAFSWWGEGELDCGHCGSFHTAQIPSILEITDTDTLQYNRSDLTVLHNLWISKLVRFDNEQWTMNNEHKMLRWSARKRAACRVWRPHSHFFYLLQLIGWRAGEELSFQLSRELCACIIGPICKEGSLRRVIGWGLNNPWGGEHTFWWKHGVVGGKCRNFHTFPCRLAGDRLRV